MEGMVPTLLMVNLTGSLGRPSMRWEDGVHYRGPTNARMEAIEVGMGKNGGII
jgi:hypothetical protein